MGGLGFRYDTDERWSLPNPTDCREFLKDIVYFIIKI
jgi:hypothetical protein